MAGLPVLAGGAGLVVVGAAVAPAATFGSAVPRALLAAVAGGLVAYVAYACLVVVCVRLAGRGLSEGYHPARSAVALRAWAVERIMDASRSILFPV
ncbi:MAG TPA: hypothetical protein PKB06_08635, partial [Actinotalea sp.]|nr:hypothetical protein [Actinotalea sp.]